MHTHGHEHSSHGSHGHSHGHTLSPTRRLLHHDWRFWLAVVLMLGAMAAYVLSLDEAVVPGGDGQEQPAAAADAAGL